MDYGGNFTVHYCDGVCYHYTLVGGEIPLESAEGTFERREKMSKKYFGVMLDMSRNGVMKPDVVKRYVDYLAAFGWFDNAFKNLS